MSNKQAHKSVGLRICEYIRRSKNDINLIKPLYWESFDDKQYILFSTPSKGLYDKKNGIYAYSFTKNDWHLLSSYPQSLKLDCHHFTIDQKSHIIYVFGGSYHSFAALNLRTLKWNVKVGNYEAQRSKAKKYATLNIKDGYSLFIPSPINTIHAISGDKHFKYDQNENKFICSSSVFNDQYKMVFVESMKRVYLFAQYRENIFYYNIQEKKLKLHECKIEMPHIERNYVQFDIILIHEHIAVIYYWWLDTGYIRNKDIYCIDLLNEKIYKSHQQTPNLYGDFDFYLIKCQKNTVHKISTSKNPLCSHQKWLIKDVIPKELHEDYRDIDDVLVSGYTRLIEKDYKLYTIIPHYISKIIWKYYPGILKDIQLP